MRDTPKSVVKHYKPSTPFYGNVHGKLSFGQSEMGEFQVVCRCIVVKILICLKLVTFIFFYFFVSFPTL